MKKVMGVVLCMILCVFGLTGCRKKVDEHLAKAFEALGKRDDIQEVCHFHFEGHEEIDRLAGRSFAEVCRPLFAAPKNGHLYIVTTIYGEVFFLVENEAKEILFRFSSEELMELARKNGNYAGINVFFAAQNVCTVFCTVSDDVGPNQWHRYTDDMTKALIRTR